MNDDYFDDYSDDFYDDFNEDDDSFEDSFDDDFGPEDSLDHVGTEDEPAEDDICDDEFTTEDAVMTGIAYGWGYEEGLEEAERSKLEKKLGNDRDSPENNS